MGTAAAMPFESASWLAPDPVLPSRDTLLDPEQVTRLLNGLAGGASPVTSCNLRRVKYRIGESLRVVYDVVAGGHQLVMSARTFPDSHAVFLESPAAAPVFGMPGVAHDRRTGTVWWTLPNDRKMHNLATLLDPPRRVRESSGIDWDRSTLVEYAPERSATVRVDDMSGHVSGFAKAYRDRDPFDVAAEYNHVAASVALIDGVRTPRAIGWARPDRIVVLEPMPGRSWKQLPIESQPHAMQRFGSALAHIHSMPPDFSRGPFQRFRPARVRNSAELVAAARPDVAAAALRMRDLLATGPTPPRAVVTLHGDVHANNVLYHGDQVHVIDFDQGGSGTAAADLGSMLASLMVTTMIEPESTGPGLRSAFLSGYQSVRALPPEDELRWYTAAAFVVERSIRAVNRVNVAVLAALPELLSVAEEVFLGKVDVSG